MIRATLALVPRRSTPRWNTVAIRAFGGKGSNSNEEYHDPEEDAAEHADDQAPMLDPSDMELFNYNPKLYEEKYNQNTLTEEDKEEKEQHAQAIRDELDTRTGRGWTDDWEITDEEWASQETYDDLPDWTPEMASKLSLERVKVRKGGMPTLDELVKIPLPPPPAPHPSRGQAKIYAEYRKNEQMKYIQGEVEKIAEPKLEDIRKLKTWEEKQDAIDELFESVEFELKEKEEILGRYPKFGEWVEKSLEDYLEKVQTSDDDTSSKEPSLAEQDEKALPLFVDLFDKKDIPDGEEVAPPAPSILYPLKEHKRGGPGRMVEEWELSAHDETRRIMLRQSARNIANIVNDKKSFRVLVTGDKGVGKSVALATIVAAARKSGNIVMYVPDGNRLRQHGYYNEPNPKYKGLFDLPWLARELCQEILDSHEKELEGMTASEETRKKHTSESHLEAMPDEYKDDNSLISLLKLGKDSAVHSSMCYCVVLETLVHQEEKRFLLVLDEFNCYYDHGHYFHVNWDEEVNKPIPNWRMTLFKSLMEAMGLSSDGSHNDMQEEKLVPIKNGGVLAAISENCSVPRKFTDGLKESANKIAAESESESPLFIEDVPKYSSLEVEHVLSNFDVTGIGRLRFDRGDTVINQQEVEYLKMVSASNPQLLLDACIV